MAHEITFQAGTVTNCDFIGRTITGVCAVVRQDGIEVFRSEVHVKRITGRLEAQKWIEETGGQAR